MITFSGIDCSGKSTQIEIYRKQMELNGRKVKVIWSRGGYTSWIEKFKTLIRKDKKYSTKEQEQYRADIVNNSFKSKLLLWASIVDLIRFYALVFRLIEFWGTTIICDRYIWDTYIDFKLKYPNHDFEKWISWKILLFLMKKPKHSIILTIPADESMRRSELKVEPFPESFDERVIRIKKYNEIIGTGKWQTVINAEKSVGEVKREIELTLGMYNEKNNHS